ncbi:hypothetical protein [Methylovirgula sp. 4M-Z18]|uniref:hypothetical protein n=1 Tax=Methylovirgula sp. 4M-Z18 TaxID=2293567 RepID=UPI000E2EB918|nr:hypothetical protein [Methylovirgula sp. 4M-Z18]RFB74963.1 hypothetical protein DYH55_23105 [Methylovirgula sp. 4M-Z18]
MRLVGTILFLLASGAALAASPEDDYMAARDKAVSTIERLYKSKAKQDSIDAVDAKARADLETRLSMILGPFAIVGFPTTGKINLESLSRSDVGFGMLDGLRHAQSEDGPSVLATTRGLVERWLKPKASEKDAQSRVPGDIDQALKSDNFYTYAIGSDSAFSTTLDFPLEKPAGADMALGRLGGWAQETGPNPDQHIVVAIVKGQSIMIADAPVTPPIPEIADCKALWTSANATAEKFEKIYQDSGLKNQKAFAAASAAQDKGDRDYRACVAERLPHEPVFPALLKQAQELANHMAGK